MKLLAAIACIVLASSLYVDAAPYKAGLRYIVNPLATNETNDDENLPIWYPIPLSDNTPAWTFNGDYPSATSPRDVAPANGSFPVVIFSPGVNVVPEAYNGILSRIAAEGYIIVTSKSLWEYYHRDEWVDPTNPLGSRFTVIFARPLAMKLALDAFWNATHGIGPDKDWFNQYPNLANWNVTTVAMGHSLGSNTALILGGMALRPCSPLNLTADGDYIPLFDNPQLCNNALKAGGLEEETAPYNLTHPLVGAVVALDPGPSYWFPPGNEVRSWFTDESFDNFAVPLYLSTMVDSFMNLEAAVDSFPNYNNEDRVLVIHAQGSHNTYLNDCEYRKLLNLTDPSPGCSESDTISLDEYHNSISRTITVFLNYVTGKDNSREGLLQCEKALAEVQLKGFGGWFVGVSCFRFVVDEPPEDEPPSSATMINASFLLLVALLLAQWW